MHAERSISRGHFEEERVGINGVPIGKVLGRQKNATILQDFTYTISIFFLEWYPGSPQCLDPDTNFRFARQRSYCSYVTKRPLPLGLLFWTTLLIYSTDSTPDAP